MPRERRDYITLRRRVLKLFTYNPASGELIWKPRPRSSFASPQSYAAWHTRYAGKRAGSVFTCGTDKKQYRRVHIDGVDISEHIVVWLMLHKKVAVSIDHINGDGTDNRACNLREATLSQNQYNRRMSVANSTGLKGVSRRRDSDKFFAFIKEGGRSKYLGRYNTAEEASAAYVGAATRIHGCFINLGEK